MSTLFDDALRLKSLPRAGWIRAGIESPESVAAHSWGMAWLVMNLCPEGVDTERALKIALVHDLPEVIAGDITPHDGLSKSEKHSLEARAAEQLFTGRPDLMALWQEYNAAKTPEAMFVKECDALDMALQALRYAKVHHVDTAEFIASAKAKIRSPTLLNFLDEHAKAHG